MAVVQCLTEVNKMGVSQTYCEAPKQKGAEALFWVLRMKTDMFSGVPVMLSQTVQLCYFHA
jgi:hypothetical protein